MQLSFFQTICSGFSSPLPNVPSKKIPLTTLPELLQKQSKAQGKGVRGTIEETKKTQKASKLY